MVSSSDERLMRLAIMAACEEDVARVRPNPRVGAAIETRAGAVFCGAHEMHGGPHAEIQALNRARAAGADLRGATMAVTLEPCNHFGSTPPCAQAIAASGISRLLISQRDPNAKVAGGGASQLRSAGVTVYEEVLKEEGERVDFPWLWAQRKGRPWFHLKVATSLDGRQLAADGKSKWITSNEMRALGHQIRARVQAVVTGLETLRQDLPRLTARTHNGIDHRKQPMRIALTRGEPSSADIELAGSLGIEILSAIHPQVVSDELWKRGCIEALVESGPRLSHAFLESQIVQELHWFRGIQILGGVGGFAPLGGGSMDGSTPCALISRVLGTEVHGEVYERWLLNPPI